MAKISADCGPRLTEDCRSRTEVDRNIPELRVTAFYNQDFVEPLSTTSFSFNFEYQFGSHGYGDVTIKFDDGNGGEHIWVSSAPDDPGAVQQITITPSSLTPGTQSFEASAKITDEYGHVYHQEFPYSITITGPQASGMVMPDYVMVDQGMSANIDLDGSMSTPGTFDIQTYEWNISGYGTTTGQNASVSLMAGNYSVTLTVTDIAGNVHSTNVGNITVEENMMGP